MKYLVEISETLQRKVEIEADNPSDAIQVAKDKYYNSEIVLDADDIVDGEVGFFVVKKISDEEVLYESNYNL